jgi:hypothetical protein
MLGSGYASPTKLGASPSADHGSVPIRHFPEHGRSIRARPEIAGTIKLFSRSADEVELGAPIFLKWLL